MANTPDPRDFYRVSRAVPVPSLWRESLGRVPMEALANGIPVVASDRGALPETLGDAGFVITIPERFGPSTLEIPTPGNRARWCNDHPQDSTDREDLAGVGSGMLTALSQHWPTRFQIS